MERPDRSTGPLAGRRRASPTTPAHPRVPWNRGSTLGLWLVVLLVATMDVGLTAIGLQHGFVEVNPIARAGIAVAGTWALIGGKGVALGVGAVCARSLDRQRYLVPVVFIVVWGVAAVANARLILLSL